MFFVIGSSLVCWFKLSKCLFLYKLIKNLFIGEKCLILCLRQQTDAEMCELGAKC